MPTRQEIDKKTSDKSAEEEKDIIESDETQKRWKTGRGVKSIASTQSIKPIGAISPRKR